MQVEVFISPAGVVISTCWVERPLCPGHTARLERTYFILYDYIEYFDKDSASFLQRDRFVEIINSIFKEHLIEILKSLFLQYRYSLHFCTCEKYTAWEHMADGYLNQKMIGDVVGDYFFICPTNHFANTLAEHGVPVYYYYFTQYTAWEHMADGYLNQKMIGDVVGDYFFICPTNHFANTLAEHGVPVYYYYFTQRSTTSMWGDWMGVMHGDEIDYVFGRPLEPRPTSDEDAWPLYSRNTPQFFTWSADSIGHVGTGPRATACAFWNQFMPRITQAQDKSLSTSRASDSNTCPSVELVTKKSFQTQPPQFHLTPCTSFPALISFWFCFSPSSRVSEFNASSLRALYELPGTSTTEIATDVLDISVAVSTARRKRTALNCHYQPHRGATSEL
ncbi:hypothetical protein B566_EDAN014658 [Ephemera danica]|nr:hypothetical protein B566_EDAN014658 [Ephemera danica]